MRTILCPVDLSSVADREIRMAGGLCHRFGARLVVQHCISGTPPPGLGASWMFAEVHGHEQRDEAERTRKKLRDLFALLPPGVRAEGIASWGPLERLVLEVAEALPADLVVMATHGRSTAERSSFTERMILDAPCPVLTTRDRSAEGALPDFASDAPVRALVPVDFSPTSRRALDYAAALSRRLPLELHVVYADEGDVANPPEIENTILAALPEDVAGRVAIEIVSGPPVEAILRREQELAAGLVVMGTHRKGWIEHFLTGSTSREMLQMSACPVWFVPERAKIAGTLP